MRSIFVKGKGLDGVPKFGLKSFLLVAPEDFSSHL